MRWDGSVLGAGAGRQPVSDEGHDVRVGELVDRAPLALAGMKANLRDSEHLDLAGYLDVETTRQASTVTTADALEAGTAFFEKRPPRFQGR